MARSVVSSEMDKFGRKRVTGGGGGRAAQGLPGKQPAIGFAPTPAGTGLHHRALQRLSEYSPLDFGTGDGGGPWQALRERRERIRHNTDQRQQEEIYQKAVDFLMAPEIWTFGNMLAYQRKLLDLMGATGVWRKLAGDNEQIKHLEKELKVLEAMTPVELASNHRSVFTTNAIRLIAEKSGTTRKFVNQVIMEHDILRGDRRWFMMRQQFGKPLPKTFEDREFLAEFDKPLSEAEKEVVQEHMDKHQEKTARKKPPRIKHIWFRQPTSGGNRWSSRPPRWYPTRWRMRPERRARLSGVGRPGSGGDRGRPWGNLARLP